MGSALVLAIYVAGFLITLGAHVWIDSREHEDLITVVGLGILIAIIWPIALLGVVVALAVRLLSVKRGA